MLSFLQKDKIILIIYILFSLYIFLMWVWGADTIETSFTGDPKSQLSDIIYGNAHRPFAERALIPFLTVSVYKIIPESITTGFTEFLLNNPKFKREITRLGWEEEFIIEYIIALFFAFCAFAGFTFILRALFRELYDTNPAVINIAPVLCLISLPPFFHTGTHYIYDFPALFFFSTGLLLLIQRRFAWFYIIFLVGIINKETMFFLVFAYLILFIKQHNRNTIIINTAAMLLIFAAVKIMLAALFSDNPGSSVSFYLFKNIHLMMMPYSFTGLLIFILILVLTFYDFRSKHEVLRKSLLLLIPFGFAFFLFGTLVEIRTLYEIVPIIFLLIMHTIVFSFLKIPFKLKKI